MALGVPDPQKLYDMIVEIYNFIVAIPSGIWDKITSVYENVLWVVAQLKKIPDGIFDLLKKAVDFAKDIPGTLYSWASSFISWIPDQIMALVKDIMGAFNSFVSQIPGPYMIVAPIVLVALLGVGYFMLRLAIWAYHQIPVIG